MRKKEDDLLKYPETAYLKLSSDQYQAEEELAEKYRSVVAEILRLSLAGIAVFAFLKNQRTLETTKYWAAFGVLCFAISAGLSLWFLFEASEGLRWYIAGLRYSAAEKCETIKEALAPRDLNRAAAVLKKRDRIIHRCRWSKAGAAIFLVLGVILMGIATFKPLFVSEPQKPASTSSRPDVRLSAGRPVSQYAGNAGCTGLAGA
jgi:hypothetical protein